MQFDPGWFLMPAISPALSGIALLTSLGVWLAERAETRKRKQELVTISEATNGALRSLDSKIAEIELRGASGSGQEFQPVGQSVNLTRRARALHMRGRGEHSHTIAAALGVPTGQIDLLFKLDRILQQARD